jgi:hypothetical protein
MSEGSIAGQNLQACMLTLRSNQIRSVDEMPSLYRTLQMEDLWHEGVKRNHITRKRSRKFHFDPARFFRAALAPFLPRAVRVFLGRRAIVFFRRAALAVFLMFRFATARWFRVVTIPRNRICPVGSSPCREPRCISAPPLSCARCFLRGCRTRS